eukprot:CAMPEP_0115128404 /NCGR_PEP_ID=MMETSP0227-20121206/51106_1 /TAXON_ID=89957 /ORGANISM="Polarella glacialis, Strain CCMP 1383" /LENGTH=982 /DNA_ID=CAMNT_0002532937 /DNA_START=68 /DNA_END=3016 /DNA_ORIENTATION=+
MSSPSVSSSQWSAGPTFALSGQRPSLTSVPACARRQLSHDDSRLDRLESRSGTLLAVAGLAGFVQLHQLAKRKHFTRWRSGGRGSPKGVRTALRAMQPAAQRLVEQLTGASRNTAQMATEASRSTAQIASEASRSTAQMATEASAGAAAKLQVLIPTPPPPSLEETARAFAAQVQASLSELQMPKELHLPEVQVPKELQDAIQKLLSSIPIAAPSFPTDMQADLTKVLSEAVAYFQTPEAMVLAAPVGIGSLLVVLLSLRRGRQAWAEELPMVYDGPWIEAYWQRRPLRLLLRFIDVSLRAGSFSIAMEVDKWTNKTEEMTPQRAREAKELITDLGPAFVKLVQVWASRPDILPEAYQKEFEQLLERVRPFGKEEALQSLSRNFGGEDKVRSMFDDMAAFDKPVASASIGQVYKASIKGREVAVKVQRPDVREQVTLDLYVIRRLAAAGQYLPIERYASQFKGLFELIDRAAPPFIEELDYELEANNQRRFGDLMSNCDLVADTVVVPEVVLARREVLVQEWLAGVKLTEPGAAKDQAERVVKVLLNSYMVQLMETGFLHGDPHPGNFVLMPSGKIGILDYGLMTTISENKRVALIEYIMHVQAKMFDECLTDLVNLDFLPAGIASDKQAKEIIVPRLANTLTILFEQSDLRVQREKFIKSREELQSTGKLEKLQEELTAIAQKYGSFRLPGYATLIIRCLATLEGVGMKATSKFSLASETFPYIARRLLTDDSLRIREALRAYLYKGRSRISAKRVDDLASGFKSFTNLMKGSRSSAADSGAPRQWETSAPDLEIVATRPVGENSQGAAPQLDQASQDIAKVIFSPDGNFLQELLIDEGVAAIDALSRASLVQLARTLGPLSFPIMAPLSLFLGGGAESRLLSREDKEALLLIRRIVQLVQPGPSADSPSEAAAMTSEDVGRTFEDLQKLGPLAAGLLPAITPGAAAFAQRFAQQLASRALSRVASDIERGAGLRTMTTQR